MLSSLLSFLRPGNPDIDLHAEDFASELASTPNAVVLDVRTSGEYNGGRLPNARLMDISNPSFGQKLEALDRATPYFVYCASGSRSAHAARMMGQMGFSHVRNLAGGIMSWRGKIVR